MPRRREGDCRTDIPGWMTLAIDVLWEPFSTHLHFPETWVVSLRHFRVFEKGKRFPAPFAEAWPLVGEIVIGLSTHLREAGTFPASTVCFGPATEDLPLAERFVPRL
jgi:hypothetical protein